jgi:hypothetical protein
MLLVAAYLATVIIALYCLIALAWQLRNRMLHACLREDRLAARLQGPFNKPPLLPTGSHPRSGELSARDSLA